MWKIYDPKEIDLRGRLSAMTAVLKRTNEKRRKVWCRARVGIAHDMELVKIDRMLWSSHWLWLTWRCRDCKKKAYQYIER